MSKIFFQLWNPTGLINQVMSLELAVGIANQTKSTVIVHYASHDTVVPIYTPSIGINNQRSHLIDNSNPPHILDLLDFEEDLIFIDEKINKFPQEKLCISDMMKDYYFSLENSVTEDELSFAEGRQRIEIVSGTHLKRTLGWYSRFFYNRSIELDLALSKVRFKKEYIDFAETVAKSLGDFQGVHLRLSDHIKMFNTTQEMFENKLNQLEQVSLPIVVSTDEPNHKMVQDNKHRFVLLDEYIVNTYEKEFKEFKFKDEVVFGLICNLVLHKSKRFVGTSGSTYTAYIHRVRNQRGLGESWEFFDNPLSAMGHPYSWNGSQLDGIRKMWWREWPESKLNI